MRPPHLTIPLALWAASASTPTARADEEATHDDWDTLAADNQRRTYNGTGGRTVTMLSMASWQIALRPSSGE